MAMIDNHVFVVTITLPNPTRTFVLGVFASEEAAREAIEHHKASPEDRYEIHETEYVD